MRILVVSLGLLLAGCSTVQPGPQPPANTPPAAAFPVTIKHTFGETVVRKPPERVVALGWNDIAVANALGANIVGAVRYFDSANTQVPYLRTRLKDDAVTLDTNALNMEKIAAYRPDLILAVSAFGVDKAKYETLSKIAPVLPYEKSLYGSTMDQDALMIGRALGDEAGARKLVEDADASVAKLKADLPKLAGKSYLFGQARGDVLPLIVGKDNLSTKFMNSLGLKVPDAFANAKTSADLAPGTVALSYETADQLDTADALFMAFADPSDRQRFESNPLTRDLMVIREGRYLATTLPVAQLLQAPDVVGVHWLIEQLQPTLQKIGAPTTSN
jgi:iron complex transport system substrate-binding protein